jgi:hypothetical protein
MYGPFCVCFCFETSLWTAVAKGRVAVDTRVLLHDAVLEHTRLVAAVVVATYQPFFATLAHQVIPLQQPNNVMFVFRIANVSAGKLKQLGWNTEQLVTQTKLRCAGLRLYVTLFACFRMCLQAS